MIDRGLQDMATILVMQRLLMAVVREQLVEATRQGNTLLLEQYDLVIPVARFYSMGRFDLLDWPYCQLTRQPVSSLKELAARLHSGLDQEVIGRLVGELENSRDNLAEALRAKEYFGAGQVGEGGLADWEARVWEGHPLHPGNRLRTGITKEAQLSYAPEWQAKFPLHFLRLPKEDLVVEGDFNGELAKLYPELEKYLDSDLTTVIPVHPWAAQSDLPRRFKEQFASGRFCWVDFEQAVVRPTMSFRTVIFYKEGQETSLHLKLPLALQTTGAVRTVSAAATKNGPLMSNFLKRIWVLPQLEISQCLEGLSLMEEVASFRLQANECDQARFLSGILRKAPPCPKEAWRVPAAALLEPSANPLFLRVAKEGAMSCLELWRRYCQALIPPLAFLCGRLAIALEAHPQNVVAQFRRSADNSWQVQFLYRDLGGIRMNPHKLEAALRDFSLSDELKVPQFYPGSATTTDSLRDLCSKFIYSLLQNHLGEMIRAIVRASGQPERPYWAIVLDVLKEQASSLGAELGPRVFDDYWDFKSMWRMRMDSKVTEYTFAPVENPLYLKENS